MDAESVRLLSAGLCMAVGTIAPAIAEGWIARSAMEAMGRNPQVADSMFTKMIVAMAITEAVSIYAFLISLILIFVA